MKFDSYQRFIRSDLYKRCLDAEENQLPLPYPGEQPDVGLRTGPPNALNVNSANAAPAGKLKKSLSNAEDRRRKSLLPWHRKQRCKSKDRQESDGIKSMLFASTSSIPKALAAAAAAAAAGQPLTTANSDLASSRSSLSSFDAALSQQQQRQQHQHGETGGSVAAAADDCKRCLCRVLLADGATTIVQTRPDETIRDMIDRLLEKRAILYRAFEAFLLTGANGTSNKPLNLDEPSSTIAGKEVTVDQRIVFKLDLPNRKVISVKSKTTKALEDVLRPILNKYNYRLDLVQVLTRDRSAPLNMSQSVQETDGQRLQVVLKSSEMLDEEDAGTTETTPPLAAMPLHPHVAPLLSPLRAQYYGGHQRSVSHGGHSPPAYLPPPVPYDLQQHPSAVVAAAASAAEPGYQLQHHQQQYHHPHSSHQHINQPQLHPHHHHQRLPSYPQSHLDEITNKVFNELLQEKVVSQQQHQSTSHPHHQHPHGALHSQQQPQQPHHHHPQQQQSHHQHLLSCSQSSVQSSGVAAAATTTADQQQRRSSGGGIETQSTRSADWDTESGSSRFDRLRRNNAKKMEFLGRGATETQHQKQQQQLAAEADATFAAGICDAGKRPLMAKWKAGVKLQVTHKSDNHGKSAGLLAICSKFSYRISHFYPTTNRPHRRLETGSTLTAGGPTRHRDQFRIARLSQKQGELQQEQTAQNQARRTGSVGAQQIRP